MPKKVISHFVGLNGIGGVQSNFTEYINNLELNPSEYRHKIYTIGDVDPHYQISIDVLNIRKISNLYSLMLDIVYRDVVVHLYNNLSSYKVALFLAFLPVNKLIVHERGTIWNQKSSNWLIPRFVAWKASVVISNSIATKTMLKKKFNIDSKKIRVLHNGINISNSCIYNDIRKKKSVFRIGFIGRLDSPKGVHVLIDAMRLLMHKNINLVIAGEGALEGVLKKKSSKLSNVKFVGRVGNPYLFISTIDLLIVPSIREPLGNVCIEAGLCKTPVLAANIDGIPEIIENRVSGELINATDKISISLSGGGIPLPEFVVDPDTQNLVSAKQINPPLLAKKILELSNNPKQMAVYAENLHNKVVEYFNIQRYTEELHAIYNECFSMYR